MPNDNFIVAKNPFLEGIKQTMNVLIGILFIILFFKFLFFLISYIYKTIKMIITELLRPFNINKEIKNTFRDKRDRDFRKNSYKDSIKNKYSPPKVNDFNDAELKDLINKMNRKY